MISSFKDKATEKLFHGQETKDTRRFPENIISAALRKLDIINAATSLRDLRSPPGNRLKALKGDLKNHFSIRVNDQWRIVFQWDQESAHDVSLTDYHD